MYFFFIIVNLLILFFYKRIADLVNLYDLPDKKRKFHSNKVPLLGGVIITINLCTFFFYSILLSDENFAPLFSSYKEIIIFFIYSLIFFVFGYLDDKIDLSANLKFLFKSLIIVTLIFFNREISIQTLNFSIGGEIYLGGGLKSILFTLLCFLLFINAFNMFDGINLQSGTYSLFFLVFLSLFLNNENLSIIYVLISALLLFLFLNNKNLCFLGNNGAYLIGFILSFLTIKTYSNNSYYFYADQIFLLMSLPGFELLRLAIQRILNKKHPFKADRNHLHHLLLKKVGFIKTFLIIQSIIIIPNIFAYVSGLYIFTIVLFIFSYIFLVRILLKKEVINNK